MSTPPTDPREPRVPSEAGSEQIRAHLELILGSATFSGAKNQQRLLRYLVETLLQGGTAHIKEYSLGVEVFGRGPDFDPRLDPIVRVEASRLRSRLHKFYATESPRADLMIDLPRGGYVPVVLAAGTEPAQEREETARTAPPTAAKPSRRRGIWIALLPVIALLGAAALWLAVRTGETVAYTNFTRLTRDLGRCTSPSLSPDGKRVVYARRNGGEWDIWLRGTASAEATNLTAGSGSVNLQPAFSPDGGSIAFRSGRDGGGIFLLRLAGGPIRKLAGFGFHPAWSPDGKQLAVSSDSFLEPAEFTPGRRSRIYVIDVAGGVARPVTAASYDALQPAWSPDGRRIAFWGAGATGDVNLSTIAVDSPGEQAQPVAATADQWTNWNPAWSPDGRYLYYSSDRAGTMNIWRVRIDQSDGKVLGAPEPLTTPSSYSGWISFSHDAHRLAYTRRLTYSRLYRQDFDPERAMTVGEPKELTTGERRIREPAFSPDGTWVAARVQDPQSDLVLLRPDGTGLTRLTNDGYVDRLPRWSRDGNLIVFQSRRGGRFGLWAIRPDGRELRALPADISVHTAWTPDGSLVAYPRDGKPYSLEPARRPVSPAAVVAPDLLPLAWSPGGLYVAGWLATGAPGQEPLVVYSTHDKSYWHVTGHATDPAWLKSGRGFLYGGWNSIHYADVRANTTRSLLSLRDAEIHPKFALSPDERYLLYVAMEDEEDVWIAER